MPTKRRFMLFLIVLVVMLLIKYAVGHETLEPTVGWNPVAVCGPSPTELSTSAVIAGLIWGVLIGLVRAGDRQLAARRGCYFTGDLVMLRIHG
jgi:hypothetical protein